MGTFRGERVERMFGGSKRFLDIHRNKKMDRQIKLLEDIKEAIAVPKPGEPGFVE
jgi:hypothetical protein